MRREKTIMAMFFDGATAFILNSIESLVEKVYFTGVKLTHLAMEEVEKHLQRLPNLKKWFVEISGKSA
ncbi:hypothetical protein H1Q63_03370 [Desmonostoc muscorum CCALA 125]|nr:hypothetical protein [Desmonostoc muscorum CCALA 125]